MECCHFQSTHCSALQEGSTLSLAHSDFNNPGTWFGSVTEQPPARSASPQLGTVWTRHNHQSQGSVSQAVGLRGCAEESLLFNCSCLSRKGRETLEKEEFLAGALGIRQSIKFRFFPYSNSVAHSLGLPSTVLPQTKCSAVDVPGKQ